MVLDLSRGRQHRRAGDYLHESALGTRDNLTELLELRTYLNSLKTRPSDAPTDDELVMVIGWQNCSLDWCITQLENLGRRHGLKMVEQAAALRAWHSRTVPPDVKLMGPETS